MSERTSEEQRRQALSALMDGEVEPSAVVDLCAAWRRDGELRADWHAYHLIGDVLRSDDLALPAVHDEALLGRLREQLALLPVVLAPAPTASVKPGPADGQPAQARRALRHAWGAPLAVAAGFVAVAGVLVVTRVAAPDMGPGAASLAAAPGSSAVQPVSLAEPSDAPLMADRKLIRDAHLDRYLAAHKQFGGSSALMVPGMVLRSATTVAPDR